MTQLKSLSCACCGAELTKPQFFNGKVYGFTCITKQAGKGFVKNTLEMVQVPLVKIVLPDNTTRISKLIINVNGLRVNMGAFYANREEVIAEDIKSIGAAGDSLRMVNGVVYLSKKEYNRLANSK